ncbi:hypothetical protein HU200_015080 [Digitaria exilis]|uniref:Uncharacterized protein n=1 Tax=Digitaria exilis TaxID=1010633 RepID=A0A835F9X5_9POAL|nr:hypothetical protein HU200_015080 [Digitaria exilis]
MSENNKLLDFCDVIPEDLLDGRIVRYLTLYVMIDILEKSSSSAAGNKIDKQESASRHGPAGDVSGDFLEKAWGWERLVPHYDGYVTWSDYSNYLVEYYNHNAFKFVAEAASNQNLDWLLDPANQVVATAVVKSCLEMEEELLSEWKTHCITKEAELTHELLKHGAKPTDEMIQQSSVIRMCALGLVNLKGCQSILSAAAAMVGMAKEAKRMSDWMKRENKLLTFSISEHPELEMGRFMRNRTLDVMISIYWKSLPFLLPRKQMEAKRKEDLEWKQLKSYIATLREIDEADGTKTMPPSQIVKYFDLVETEWGWDKLLPLYGVPWSDYSKYLEEYYLRNARHLVPGAAATTGSSIATLAEICIAKEADLMYELLRHGASSSDDYLIDQSTEIRMCALSLMNCTSCHSVAASAAMLGVSKEAETMCKWMSENNMLLDLDDLDVIPEDFGDRRIVRFRTLYVMIDILEKSEKSAAGNKIDKQEELLSEWKTHVRNVPDEILPVNTLIQSSLIKEHALSISGDKHFVPSTIAFVEAYLTHELLKHGADPSDDMIQQSSVIRMCALGLVNLKGRQSILSAAAMVGMAKEAKRMSDWMKRENKLLTFSMSEYPELEMGRFIRNRMLDVMISILQESSFPSSKVSGNNDQILVA